MHGGKNTKKFEKAEEMLNRLDLKNFKAFRSERTDTSTSSSDSSSSDASRIAKAVEAALREAELKHDMDGGVERAAREFETFRLRLSTTNAASTCGFFDCALIGEATTTSDIEGAVATVETSDGQFSAVFDSTGAATNENDMFTFTVQYTAVGGGEDSFTLTTDVGEFGVNVTQLTIATAAGGDAAQAQYFTTAANDAFWDAQTLLNDDETLAVTNGSSIIGCDQTFDCSQQEGVTQFSVALGPASDKEFLVANITGNTTVTFSAGVQLVNDAQAAAIGLQSLPCANRPATVYGNTVIATKRGGASTANSLEHPTLYDELAVAGDSLSAFINELQQVAGRKQLILRDVVLDTGAFSVLSHKSKFTPCFRVFPERDFEIEVFTSIRGQAGIVRSVLSSGLVGSDADGNDVIEFDAENKPAFQVNEIAFSNLANDPSLTTRPFTTLPSDVSVEIEKCPEFTYYQ